MINKHWFSLLCYLQFFIVTDLLANNSCLDMHVIQAEPLGYINSQHKMVGVQVDFLDAIEAESGICINKHLMPYARIWKSFAQKKHDGGILFKNPDRINIVNNVAFIGIVNTLVIPKVGFSIDKYQQLQSFVIGKARGGILNNRFDQDQQLTLVEVNSYDQVTKMLAAGRLNAIAGSEPVLRYQLSKFGLNDKVNLDGTFLLGTREQWLQMSLRPHHQDTIDKLRKAVDTLSKQQFFSQTMT